MAGLNSSSSDHFRLTYGDVVICGECEVRWPCTIIRRMAFTPLEDYIWIEPDAIETVTSAGIVLPTQAQEIPATGTVKAAGPGKYEQGIFVPMSVEVGDRVLFHRGHLFTVDAGDTDYTMIRATSLVAIL